MRVVIARATFWRCLGRLALACMMTWGLAGCVAPWELPEKLLRRALEQILKRATVVAPTGFPPEYPLLPVETPTPTEIPEPTMTPTPWPLLTETITPSLTLAISLTPTSTWVLTATPTLMPTATLSVLERMLILRALRPWGGGPYNPYHRLTAEPIGPPGEIPTRAPKEAAPTLTPGVPAYIPTPSVVTGTTPIAPTATPSAEGVVIPEWGWRVGAGFVYMEGLLQNTGERMIVAVTIHMTLRDALGNLLATAQAYVSGPLAPGAVTTWSTTIPDPGGVADVQIVRVEVQVAEEGT